MYSLASSVYLDQGRYDEADSMLRKTYENARRAHQDHYAAMASYNLACVAARRKDKKGSLGWLGKSVESGLADVDGMTHDPDLLSLGDDREFQRLVAAAKANPAQVTPPVER